MKTAAFIGAFGALFLLPLASTQKACAQIEWEDWPKYEALEKSLAEVKKSNPQQAVEAYRAFWNKNPKMHAISGCMTFSSLALVQRDQLKHPEEALKSLNDGLQVYGESPAVVILLMIFP
jgi:outer membrane protein assembly factor BamD (BamD/ComL family)